MTSARLADSAIKISNRISLFLDTRCEGIGVANGRFSHVPGSEKAITRSDKRITYIFTLWRRNDDARCLLFLDNYLRLLPGYYYGGPFAHLRGFRMTHTHVA
jgi:hypothetical protein